MGLPEKIGLNDAVGSGRDQRGYGLEIEATGRPIGLRSVRAFSGGTR